jgi:hypothetical protein
MPLSRRDALVSATLWSGALLSAPLVGATRLFAATDEPTHPEAVFARAVAGLAVQTAGHVGLWQMDTASWSLDLSIGKIVFRNAARWTITAPVQVIGTRATGDGTWLWAWDHPSVPANLAADARLVRDFGVAHKLGELTTRKVEADEDRCWQFTALASYLARSSGAYRGPAGKTEVFMTFGEIEIRK